MLDDVFELMTALFSPTTVDINAKGVSTSCQWQVHYRIYHLPFKQIFQDFSIAKCLSFLKQILQEEVSCQQICFCQQITSADFCRQ
jgi:hypothetical protein